MTQALPGAAYDNKIYTKYSKNTIEKKAKNKADFCEEFDLVCDQRQLLMGIVAELTDKNGAHIFAEVLPGLAALNICLAVRGVGSEKFQKLLADFSKNNPGKIAIVPDSNEDVRKILAASDVSFFFSSGEENERYALGALSYAALPITPASMQHIVEDYNPNQESGTGFVYRQENMWSAFAAIVRAQENFRFPYDWKTIQRSAIDV